MLNVKNKWTVFEDINEIAEQLANDILDVAKDSIKLNNRFSIVLTGGNSILSTYKILANSNSEWSKWHVYLGDERCLPAKDKNRNDYIINRVWLKNSPIPIENINFIRAELGAKHGALDYEILLDNVTEFDVVLLSMGSDGHVASLFPNHVYSKNRHVVKEYNSPKYPKERISMSYLRLNKARNVFKIISGKSKSASVKLLLKNNIMPINKVHGKSEKIFISKDAL